MEKLTVDATSDEKQLPEKTIFEEGTERDLKGAIEALLGDEGITDGIPDNLANLILSWAINQIEDAYEESPHFSDAAAEIRKHARDVGKIAAMISEGADCNRISVRLRRLDQMIQVEELPNDVKEAIHLLLTSFTKF